jgi:YidC/Oxa1 family membrane protein insertase
MFSRVSSTALRGARGLVNGGFARKPFARCLSTVTPPIDPVAPKVAPLTPAVVEAVVPIVPDVTTTPVLDAMIPNVDADAVSIPAVSAEVVSIPIVPTLPDAVVTDVVDKVIPVLGYSPSDLVVKSIEQMHQILDVPYWEAIALFTVFLRVALSPINIGAIRNGARMAVVRPEIDKLQKAMKADPRGGEQMVMQKYQGEMKAVFEKHQVNPLKSLVGPFVQIPVFMSMFFGIQKFGDYFPDIASGGLLWFTDLSVQDPYYILPVLNAASFLAMIEIGADGMPQEQQGMFKWAMRGLSLFMIPFTIHLPTAVYVYWTTNNIISVSQTLALKNPKMKKIFGIPEAPKAEEQPAFKNKLNNFNPITSFINVRQWSIVSLNVVVVHLFCSCLCYFFRVETERGECTSRERSSPDCGWIR